MKQGNFLPSILGGTTKDGDLTYNLTSPVGGALRNNSQEILLIPVWPLWVLPEGAQDIFSAVFCWDSDSIN